MKKMLLVFILIFTLVFQSIPLVSAETDGIDPLQKFFVYSISADSQSRVALANAISQIKTWETPDESVSLTIASNLPEMTSEEIKHVIRVLVDRSESNRGYISDMISLGVSESAYIGEMPHIVSAFNKAIIGDASDNRGFNYFTTLISIYNLYTLFGGDPDIARNYESIPGIVDMYVPQNAPEDVVKKISGALNCMPSLKDTLSIYSGNSPFEQLMEYGEEIINSAPTAEIAAFKRTLRDMGSFDGAYIPENGNEKFDGLSFRDIDSCTWAHTQIKSLSDSGVINGTGKYSFAPSENVTREQFVKMITLAFGINVNDVEDAEFNDVDKNQWYYPYICAAYKNKLITGETAEIFGVGNYITRQQMAAIVYRACKNAGVNLTAGEAKFSDMSAVDEYAKEAVNVMNASGIINGMGDGQFAPKETAIRAQAAVMIYNAASKK